MRKEVSRKLDWKPQEKVRVFSATRETYRDILETRIKSRAEYENAWKVIFGVRKLERDIIVREAQKIDREIARRLTRGMASTVAEAYHQIQTEGALHPSSLEVLQAEERAQVLLLLLATDIQENQWGVVMQKLSIREEDADKIYAAKIREVIVPLIRAKLAESLARPEDEDRESKKQDKSPQETGRKRAKQFVDIISAMGPLPRTFGREVFPDLARRALLNPFIVAEIRTRLREDFEKESQIGLHARLGCVAIGIPLHRFLKLQKEDAKKVLLNLLLDKKEDGFSRMADRMVDRKILTEDEPFSIMKNWLDTIRKQSNIDINELNKKLTILSRDPNSRLYSTAIESAEEYLLRHAHNGVILFKDYAPLIELFSTLRIASRSELDTLLTSFGLEWKVSDKQ